MAVLVEWQVPGAAPEQLYEVELRNQQRAAELGRPPYEGLLFLAATPVEDGFRIVSAWRTEDAFRTVLDAMIAPDLASMDLAVSDVRVAPVASMAIPT
jgi:hypothetical protein